MLRLREKIIEKGVSIKSVAEYSDRTQQMFNNYLKGTHSPTFETLKLIAECLECDVMELIEAPKGFDHVYTSQGVWMGIQRNLHNNNLKEQSDKIKYHG